MRTKNRTIVSAEVTFQMKDTLKAFSDRNNWTESESLRFILNNFFGFVEASNGFRKVENERP